MAGDSPFGSGGLVPRRLWPRIALAFAVLAVVSLTGLAVLVAKALQDQPALTVDSTPQKGTMPLPLDLKERIKGGTLGHGQEKRFILNTEDLNVICRSALQRRKLTGQCYADLSQDSLVAEITFLLHGAFAGQYLNISLLAQGAEQNTFHIVDLRLGALRTSSPWILAIVQKALLFSPLRRYEILRERLIRDMHVADSRLFIVVNWDRKLLSELGGLVTDAADKSRMKLYLEHLAHALNDGTQNRFVRLGVLTRSMFALALERSRKNHEPIEENRAAILVLSAYANGKDLQDVVGSRMQPARRNVLLNKRIDTAKHFLAAAVLAMSGQSTLVEMVGLAKELQDTHDGSGFSFIDLAADEAGALFGKMAISSPQRAGRIEEILSQTEDESQFIPGLKDLPESLDPEEFTQQFTAIGSPAYEALRSEIRQRILALPIYQ
jgi:hypothetical protein